MLCCVVLVPALVVCDGLIEPAPLDLDALSSWEDNCSSEDLLPGSVYISGAMLSEINGVYMPTGDYSSEEGDSCMPLYTKKIYEDDEQGEQTELKCVAFENEWSWQIQYVGEGDGGHGLAYVKMTGDDISLPGRDTMQHAWQVKVNGVYQEKSEVSMRLLQPGMDLPEELLEAFERGHAHIVQLREEYLAEVCVCVCVVCVCVSVYELLSYSVCRPIINHYALFSLVCCVLWTYDCILTLLTLCSLLSHSLSLSFPLSHSLFIHNTVGTSSSRPLCHDLRCPDP